MKASRQTGSAHMIVIAVLAIALAGTLGFVFYQNFIAKKADGAVQTVDEASKASTESSAANTTSTPASTQTTDEVTETQTKTEVDTSKYLVLDDWGVKFVLPQDGTSVMYSKSTGSNGSYGLTTKAVDALGGYCKQDSNTSGSSLVYISRQATKLTEYASISPLNNNQAINGYYYYMSGTQAPCSEKNTALQIADLAKMKTMAETISLK